MKASVIFNVKFCFHPCLARGRRGVQILGLIQFMQSILMLTPSRPSFPNLNFLTFYPPPLFFLFYCKRLLPIYLSPLLPFILFLLLPSLLLLSFTPIYALSFTSFLLFFPSSFFIVNACCHSIYPFILFLLIPLPPSTFFYSLPLLSFTSFLLPFLSFLPTFSVSFLLPSSPSISFHLSL